MTKTYNYEKRSEAQTRNVNYAVTGIVAIGTFLILKKFFIVAFGIKSLGLILTLITAAASAYAGHRSGEYVVKKIDGKTFYFESDRVVVVTEDGEYNEHYYNGIFKSALSKFSKQQDVIDTEPKMKKA